MKSNFEWDLAKEALNLQKHKIDFAAAVAAFIDPYRVVISDERHSYDEKRFFCLGRVNDRVLTIRFVYREDTIRILGAGYWRKGVKIYEEENRRRYAGW